MQLWRDVEIFREEQRLLAQQDQPPVLQCEDKPQPEQPPVTAEDSGDDERAPPEHAGARLLTLAEYLQEEQDTEIDVYTEVDEVEMERRLQEEEARIINLHFRNLRAPATFHSGTPDHPEYASFLAPYTNEPLSGGSEEECEIREEVYEDLRLD